MSWFVFYCVFAKISVIRVMSTQGKQKSWLETSWIHLFLHRNCCCFCTVMLATPHRRSVNIMLRRFNIWYKRNLYYNVDISWIVLTVLLFVYRLFCFFFFTFVLLPFSPRHWSSRFNPNREGDTLTNELWSKHEYWYANWCFSAFVLQYIKICGNRHGVCAWCALILTMNRT